MVFSITTDSDRQSPVYNFCSGPRACLCLCMPYPHAVLHLPQLQLPAERELGATSHCPRSQTQAVDKAHPADSCQRLHYGDWVKDWQRGGGRQPWWELGCCGKGKLVCLWRIALRLKVEGNERERVQVGRGKDRLRLMDRNRLILLSHIRLAKSSSLEQLWKY